jgi:chemotaxis protein CheY-P-specific phosphatase CheC
MPETLSDPIVECLVQALDQMAFLAALPPEGPLPAPSAAMLVSIDFDGPSQGHIELLADAALGAVLAANMLATSEDDPQAIAQAQDVLCELLNVSCGAYLRQSSATAGGEFKMQVPKARSFDIQQWDSTLATGGFITLDAEGRPIAIRVTRTQP